MISSTLVPSEDMKRIKFVAISKLRSSHCYSHLDIFYRNFIDESFAVNVVRVPKDDAMLLKYIKS